VLLTDSEHWINEKEISEKKNMGHKFMTKSEIKYTKQN